MSKDDSPNQSSTNNNASWSVISQVSNYATSLIFTAVLARLVLPAEFGIFTLAMTVSAFFLIFADGGMVWSLIQKQDITKREVANLRWLNGTLGLAMSVLCIILAPIVASFYGYVEITMVLSVVGLNFFITGLSTPAIMWLKRELRFKKLALIDISTTILSGGLAVGTALQGAGYWALVVQVVSKALIQAILVLFYAKCPRGWYDKQIDISKLVVFGSTLIGFGAVNYFSRNLDNVLLGVYTTTEELAYYSRAYFLMSLPSLITTGALSGLMIAILSKLQDNPDQFQAQYNQVLRLLFIVCAPAAMYFLLYPHEPILLLYGKNWLGAAPLIQALSLACLTQPIHNTMGWLFTAVGNGKMMLYWGIFAAMVLSLSFFVGVQWGALGIAISYSLMMGVFLTIGALYFAHRSAHISLLQSFKKLGLPLLCIVLTIVSMTLLEDMLLFPDLPLIFQIVIHGVCLVVLYLICLVTCYRGQVKSLLKVSI